ncbi:unnamed protein product [Miscanthus lutarioriparius]|uniref:MIP18 family-like domain-containing protein n=1 Tax=Miscanthus lutarioriparius TaxID=422564 RepID=A0A811MMA1_9POAL|nr:unnamed protein product [Miscanthus lutarioriparius]
MIETRLRSVFPRRVVFSRLSSSIPFRSSVLPNQFTTAAAPDPRGEEDDCGHDQRKPGGARAAGARRKPPHAADALDPLDVFDIVRDIKDPEHPYSLEQLSVLSQESVSVDEKLGRIQITFTPTVQHCSMATVIGLCLRLKMQNYPPHFKVDIKVAPGSLANEESGVYTDKFLRLISKK